MDASCINVDAGGLGFPELEPLAKAVIRLHLVPELVLVARARLAVAADVLDLDSGDCSRSLGVELMQGDWPPLCRNEAARVETCDGLHLADNLMLPHAHVVYQLGFPLLQRRAYVGPRQPASCNRIGMLTFTPDASDGLRSSDSHNHLIDKAPMPTLQALVRALLPPRGSRSLDGMLENCAHSSPRSTQTASVSVAS